MNNIFLMAIISTLQPLLVQLPYQVMKLPVISLAMVPWWKSLGIWNRTSKVSAAKFL